MRVPKRVKIGFNSGFQTAEGRANAKKTIDMFKDQVDTPADGTRIETI
jgi:hypothetical protein